MTPADKDRNVASLMAELRDASIEAGQLEEQYQRHRRLIRDLCKNLDHLEYRPDQDRIVTVGHVQQVMDWPDEPAMRETMKARTAARQRVDEIKKRLGDLGFGQVLR